MFSYMLKIILVTNNNKNVYNSWFGLILKTISPNNNKKMRIICVFYVC